MGAGEASDPRAFRISLTALANMLNGHDLAGRAIEAAGLFNEFLALVADDRAGWLRPDE